MATGPLINAQQRAAATYNAAVDYYDHPANAFWERFGRRTVERLGLQPGQRVLDVCCGTGASALPAAEAVGAEGAVLGVDLAADLLALARAKAAARRLAQAEFRQGDLLALDVPDAAFDAVVCVFGIFFVPDLRAAVRALWRPARPGGRLAITTWGPRMFEPVNTVFWDAVRAARPDLHKAFNPWDRICTPAALGAVLAEAGVSGAEVEAEAGEHPLLGPDAAWALVMGTGYRGTYEQLDAAGRDCVRAAVQACRAERVETNVVYAVASRPRENHAGEPA
jgi:ubiquinone/menaquinone biosynthesis C-methylase UbiE